MTTGQGPATTGRGPVTTRRRLRGVLRDLRVKKGLSVDAVARKVEWSPSKLVRIEGGQVGISVSDLNALLGVYDVHERDQVEELRALARATRQRTWWAKYQSYMPAAYLEFVGAESDAVWIRHFHPTTVPGLLQTPAYAAAIIEGTALEPLPPAVANARAEIRKLRQQHILHREDPPAVTMILDEPVIRRPVGGAATMREQLDHLLHMTEQNRIALVVVPFQAGVHPGLMGAFALMGYDDSVTEDVLVLETPHNDILLRDQPDLTAQYHRAADHLEEIGLRGRDAMKFVEQVRNDLR